jgi:hypothetical protein
MSFGEDRVRPRDGESDLVKEIKQDTAALIDLCQLQLDRDAERLRLWVLAMTAYEEAAMWAVKAATAEKSDASK